MENLDNSFKKSKVEMLHYDINNIPFDLSDPVEENRFIMSVIKIVYREEGRLEGANDIAKKIYDYGVEKDIIAKALNISVEQLDEIFKNIKLEEENKKNEESKPKVEMLHYDAKDVPFGYRDVEEENRFMMNSIKDRYREKGRVEGANDTIIKMYSGGIGKEAIANALNMPLEQLDEILKTKENN